MARNATSRGAEKAGKTGRCVVCGKAGTTPHDYICSECGDPMECTMFCRNCHRRLTLNPGTARAFLAENGYDFEDVRGVVLKVDHCGECMADDQVVTMDVYRLRFGK